MKNYLFISVLITSTAFAQVCKEFTMTAKATLEKNNIFLEARQGTQASQKFQVYQEVFPKLAPYVNRTVKGTFTANWDENRTLPLIINAKNLDFSLTDPLTPKNDLSTMRSVRCP